MNRISKNSPSLISHPLTALIPIVFTCGLIAVLTRDGRRCSLTSLVQTRRQSLKWALTTLPSREAWGWYAQITALYSIFAVPLGIVTGFLRPDVIKGTWRKFIVVPTSLFIVPGIFEEIIFRVLLLPHPKEGISFKRTYAGAMASLLAFVLCHPLNGLTFIPAARSLFTDLAFLGQAALLGLVCTAAYLKSGSIWPSIFLHWLPVTVWILFFGGAKRVGRAKQFNSM